MNILGLFARHPQPGRVKTRLAADVGDDAAASIYAAFVGDLLERFRDVGDRRIVGYAPADAAARDYFQTACNGDYELWPQPEGNLGDRIAAFFDHAFAVAEAASVRTEAGSVGHAGETRVVLIGSDSPTLPAEFVQTAFASLRDRDCALGPATDGGYYLIGLRAPRRELFEEIAWGGPDVLRQTVARVERSQLSLAVAPVWYDVDTLADLQFLRGHIASTRIAGEECLPPRTAAACDGLHDFRKS
jgi:uncharacterized protein